ncbi:MAG: hypothetical protein ACK49A_04360 [Bacteroidota bacterium]
MRTTEANELINSVIESVEKSGINADKIISPLQAARENALKEHDPLVTRALRLAWQHVESNEAFDIDLAEEIESPEENFIYFLSLIVSSEYSLTRDELRVMTNQLQSVA